MASVKMLKRALGTGSPAQQAAGLLQVVQAISGGNSTTGKMLGRMLTKGGISAPAAPAPMPEPVQEAEMSSALASKKGRVDKTQAMKTMLRTLASKPATQQVDFVVSMIKDMDLKDSAKKRLVLKLRQGLK